MGQLKDMNGNFVGEVEGNFLENPFLCVFGVNKPRCFEEGQTIVRDLVGDIKLYVRFDVEDKVKNLIQRDAGCEGFASVMASKRILEALEISEDELFEDAIRNTQGSSKNIFKEIEELSGQRTPDGIELPPVWVVQSRIYRGAGVLGNRDYLEEFRKEHGDFYIIPASIHELIFANADFVDDHVGGIDYLKFMVENVNETTVAHGDLLSDCVMKFDDTGLHEV